MKGMLAPLLAGLSLASAAEAAPAVTGDAAVDALVDDIAQGRRDAAVARISSIETITGMERLVTTPAQFVDRLLGCKGASVKYRPAFVTVKWTCPDGVYQSLFDATWRPPYITVAEFMDAKRIALMSDPNRKVVAPPAPPPLPPGPAAPLPVPSFNAAALFVNAVRGDEPENFAALFRPDARVSSSRRDLVAKVNVTELDGEGPGAALYQLTALRARMGMIGEIPCHSQSGVMVCSIQRPSGPGGAIAMLFGDGDTISGMQLIFVSP